jgi:replicative superfamily II helicase
VIILDLFRWLENEKPLYYKNSEIDQMIGRAGRNKLD